MRTSDAASVLSAIANDDRPSVRRLLRADPAAARALATRARLERGLLHWIYEGDSPLHVAAAGYRVEIARMLLDAGADPRAAASRRRAQPLHYAADGHLESEAWDPRRQVRTLRLLFEAGADLDARDASGATPLHRAVRTRCAAAARFLLEAGSDPATRSRAGSTPFHLAARATGRGGSGSAEARAAQEEILRAFLARGVSASLEDARGRTVLEWASEERIREILSS